MSAAVMKRSARGAGVALVSAELETRQARASSSPAFEVVRITAAR